MTPARCSLAVRKDGARSDRTLESARGALTVANYVSYCSHLSCHMAIECHHVTQLYQGPISSEFKQIALDPTII